MNLLRTTPNPVLVPHMEATVAARRAAFEAKIKGARTNFDVLLAQGVICTPDDEMDRAYRWDMIENIAVALGAKADEVSASLDLIQAETAEIGCFRSIVREGESRAEYLARVGEVMATLPKGRRLNANGEPTERGCKHRGKAGWKFRSFPGASGTGRMWCSECHMEFTLPPRTGGPSPDAQAAQRALVEAAAWYEAQGETALAAYTRAKSDMEYDANTECWWRERSEVAERGRVIRAAQRAEKRPAAL